MRRGTAQNNNYNNTPFGRRKSRKGRSGLGQKKEAGRQTKRERMGGAGIKRGEMPQTEEERGGICGEFLGSRGERGHRGGGAPAAGGAGPAHCSGRITLAAGGLPPGSGAEEADAHWVPDGASARLSGGAALLAGPRGGGKLRHRAQGHPDPVQPGGAAAVVRHPAGAGDGGGTGGGAAGAAPPPAGSHVSPVCAGGGGGPAAAGGAPGGAGPGPRGGQGRPGMKDRRPEVSPPAAAPV